jgi:hypothetical protein
LLRGDAGLVEGGGFDEVVNCFYLSEIEAAREEGSLGEFAGLGEAGAGGEALAEEMAEEDGGAVGGDFYDVFRGVGVGFFEKRYYGFVECFSCVVKDFGETGLRGGEGVAELEEGFGYGAGCGTGEADYADASTAGWGGDGDDGVFGFGHLLMVICRYFFGLVFGGGRGVFTWGLRFPQVFLCGFLLVIECIFVVGTWLLSARFLAANFSSFLKFIFSPLASTWGLGLKRVRKKADVTGKDSLSG